MENYLNIEIAFDTICPWCFIAQKRLDKVLSSSFSDVKPNFDFTPFPLLADKEHILKYYKDNNELISKEAKKVGIEIHIDKIQNIPDTRPFHLLIKSLSNKDRSKVPELLERLFYDFFCFGVKQDTFEYLESLYKDFDISICYNNYSEILSKVIELRDKGIKVIPAFVFNDKYTILGAQSEKSLQRMLEISIINL